MLDMSRTRIHDSIERALLSTISLSQEGLAMQGVFENNVQKARPSTGTTDTVFLGFSWGIRYAAPTSMVKSEVTVASGTSAKLTRVSLSATDMFVMTGGAYGGTKLTQTGSAPNSGEYKLEADGVTVTLNVAQSGASLLVTYRYSPTVIEAQALVGDALAGPAASNALGQTTIITRGYIYTDQFDASVDWSTIDTEATAEVLSGLANGRVGLTAAAGCSMKGRVTVVAPPTPTSPWLGLYMSN